LLEFLIEENDEIFQFFEENKINKDEEFKRILDFCKHEGFIKILGSLLDEYFFSPDTHKTR